MLCYFFLDYNDEEVQEEASSASLKDEIEELKKEIDQINHDFAQDAVPMTTEPKEEDNLLSEEQKNKKKVSIGGYVFLREAFEFRDSELFKIQLRPMSKVSLIS